MSVLGRLWLAVVLAACVGVPVMAADADPYEQYVNTSADFKPVRQDKDWCLAAFPSWKIMPWTFQWTIGYTPESGQWARDHGYRGAFVDRGNVAEGSSPTGRLEWIDQFDFRFYMDHTAGKGALHLWDGDHVKPHLNALHGTGVRNVPLNAALVESLHKQMREHIAAVKASPNRSAYALDDEISWGHFVHPTMWRITDDAAAYGKWLTEVYGAQAPPRRQWVSYEAIRPQLASWSVRDFDASPLLDQWTFNDAYWNNLVGELVDYSNQLDPHTPCGFVGGQAPSAFGGFDYARLMRKVQFLEAYNVGGSQAIIRSFNRHNALPTVTTHFHQSVSDDIWQTWYYLAHGNRGFISWVDGWFDGKQPKAWHDQVAPTFVEADEKIGPLLAGAEWQHDGVAIYYNHASIQLGWILDAEAHGKTWINRNNDDRLGASHHVRHAWENMLRDSGVQYDFINYVDVIQQGVPDKYRVLILPATLCLSDCEARRIREFCAAGGTVIADYLPGVWDQHGRGRAGGGALDDLFGVQHDPGLRNADVFGGRLWCEVDQDANFSWKTYEEFLTNQNSCLKDDSGFHKAVRAMPTQSVRKVGAGTAVLINLSPQWYNAYRSQGFAAAQKRSAFLRHVHDTGIARWVELKGAGEAEHGYEITYWKKDGRTIVVLCLNPEVIGSSTGGGNSVGLKTDKIPIALRFAKPIRQVRNERSGQGLPEGQEFALDWIQNQAVVLSFADE